MNWCKKLKWVVVVFCHGWLCVSQAQAAPPVVAAGSRVALLIGNAKYNAGLPALTNPGRDVATLSQSLKKLDFEVQVVSDADFKSMSRAVRGFGTKAQGAEVAFFYYSGHGMQAREENYLIPVDARVESEADLDSEAMSLKALMRQLEEARPKTAVVVLDACRDNPVASRSKSATKGLGRVQNPPVNTLVVFAAQAGTTAADNGVFAGALAREIGQPGQGLRGAFDNVGEAVRLATRNMQSIQRDDQLVRDIVLVPGRSIDSSSANSTQSSAIQASGTPPLLPAQNHSGPEEDAWTAAKVADSADGYAAYLDAFPGGRYHVAASIALKRLNSLHAPTRSNATATISIDRIDTRTPLVNPNSVAAESPSNISVDTGKNLRWSFNSEVFVSTFGSVPNNGYFEMWNEKSGRASVRFVLPKHWANDYCYRGILDAAVEYTPSARMVSIIPVSERCEKKRLILNNKGDGGWLEAEVDGEWVRSKWNYGLVRQ